MLSLDLPSGLHADSGAVLGSAVRATRTITFVGLKSGLFLGEGPDRVGALPFARLGVPESAASGVPVLTRIGPEQMRAALPPRRRGAHKGEHGRVLVIGGKFSKAWMISCVLGFIVCPPSTMPATPKLPKTLEIPGPGYTAITAI